MKEKVRRKERKVRGEAKSKDVKLRMGTRVTVRTGRK